MRREALDGARRRRMYLFRHGSVDYVKPDGSWVEDPDLVALNEHGWRQAGHMRDAFREVVIDKALCSGLLRTRQTAETVLADRTVAISDLSDLEEIRPGAPEEASSYDLLSDVAFSHWRAMHPGARFLGGERYSDFYARITSALDGILADAGWHNIAVFAHGGTNAAILGWVTGLGLDAFGLFDQETCCLNVIDFDESADGLVRRTLRAVNVTATDPVKSGRHAGDMELLAKRLQSFK